MYKESLFSPIPRGGRRISSFVFLSRHPFGYYRSKKAFKLNFRASYITIVGTSQLQVQKLKFERD